MDSEGCTRSQDRATVWKTQGDTVLNVDVLTVQQEFVLAKVFNDIDTVDSDCSTDGTSVATESLQSLVNSEDTVLSFGHDVVTFDLEFKVLTVQASGVWVEVAVASSEGKDSLLCWSYLLASSADGAALSDELQLETTAALLWATYAELWFNLSA